MEKTVRGRARKAGQFLADRLPAVVIFGLIALYYIQLSHMGS